MRLAHTALVMDSRFRVRRFHATAARCNLLDTIEGFRLHSADCAHWQRWGPYLSERQWGTVREDYSEDGTAWDYFPHDHARSRAYRWGEDGIAGFGDDQLSWCVSLALWNEQRSDPEGTSVRSHQRARAITART